MAGWAGILAFLAAGVAIVTACGKLLYICIDERNELRDYEEHERMSGVVHTNIVTCRETVEKSYSYRKKDAWLLIYGLVMSETTANQYHFTSPSSHLSANLIGFD